PRSCLETPMKANSYPGVPPCGGGIPKPPQGGTPTRGMCVARVVCLIIRRTLPTLDGASGYGTLERLKYPQFPHEDVVGMADTTPSPLPLCTAEQRVAAVKQFDRANQVLASGDHDYAAQLLLGCCKIDPGNATYRQSLRQTQKLR